MREFTAVDRELAGLLLTFDVGRIFLASDLSGEQVREQQVVSREDFPGALEIADEEDLKNNGTIP